jgi:mitochondrial import inner membrane translocase subunit TIM50
MLLSQVHPTAHSSFVQDLSYLNRDLSKVILVDTHEDHISTHRENSVLVPQWKGDPRDKGLIALIPFLEGPSLPLLDLHSLTH